MGTMAVALFIGVILAIPVIYILELDSGGAITLTIFLCSGMAGSLLAFIKFMKAKKEKEDTGENQSIGA